MTALSSSSTAVTRRYTTGADLDTASVTLSQQVDSYADTVKGAVAQATRLRAQSDITATAAAKLEGQIVQLINSRRDLDLATQQIENKDRFLTTRSDQHQVSMDE